MYTSTQPWPASTSFHMSSSRHTWNTRGDEAGEFFQAFGFVAREGEEDQEAAAGATAAAA
jgi:hypothetical protein